MLVFAVVTFIGFCIAGTCTRTHIHPYICFDLPGLSEEWCVTAVLIVCVCVCLVHVTCLYVHVFQLD